MRASPLLLLLGAVLLGTALYGAYTPANRPRPRPAGSPSAGGDTASQPPRPNPYPTLQPAKQLQSPRPADPQPSEPHSNHHLSHGRVPACRRHGDGAYCSAGLTRGYLGPLDTAAQLRAALSATAYRNELIVFSDTRIADAAQALSRLRGGGGGGYGHVLCVMPEPGDCSRLDRALTPWAPQQGPLSCGTYATRDESGEPYPSGFRYLARPSGMVAWWRKWFTVARSVALGYGVLAVDSDVLVLSDWYWRAKQEPLRGFSMISQSETPTIHINGGFSYFQNASSAGPVSWVLFEAMHRAVRWAEDMGALANISAVIASNQDAYVGANDDQMELTFCMWNAVMGQIRFPEVSVFLRDDHPAIRRLNVTDYRMFMDRNSPRFTTRSGLRATVRPAQQRQDHFQDQEFALPAPLAAHACEFLEAPGNCSQPLARATLRTAQLRMPHSGGRWPPERGGYPFNRTPGPATLAYRQAFRDLGVPLPPDPEDPAQEAAARATRPEAFAFLATVVAVKHGNRGMLRRHSGAWAESTYDRVGRYGYWHTHLGPPPVQAMGHMHGRIYDGDFQKQTALQASGHWDWRLTARLANSSARVYHATFPTWAAELAADPSAGSDLGRVVAYAAGAIGPGLTQAQYLSAARGLAQVAVALGAVAAWPPAPCDAEWVLTAAALEARRAGQPAPRLAPPWVHLDTTRVVPFGESLETLQCEWADLTWEGCLMNGTQGGQASGRALLALEWAHMRRRSRRRHDASSGSGGEHSHNASALLHNPSSSSGPHLASAHGLEHSLETTLMLGEVSPSASGASSSPAAVSASSLLALNAAALALRVVGDAVPVLWLDRAVSRVEGMGEAEARVWSTWQDRCKGLRDI
ncbi:hypothetical protein HYH03_002982 [Edaphochlamys debaryana]|uniref:Nucleotide-diphospho-sugar transferase domain-containing protein n=1 Tax=Edaphochlamys debaryana TaxID=47281 RepID=A0A836C4Y3_9CHLO|nr:hypothetical protein HYH03_002982 [Edaphochlamys debaryana]|eukprot:KAG2499408.1 hypothetical protein HYH03_002982 [Edaphochlamys debaryana]